MFNSFFFLIGASSPTIPGVLEFVKIAPRGDDQNVQGMSELNRRMSLADPVKKNQRMAGRLTEPGRYWMVNFRHSIGI